jgi:hypothetical protein
MVVGMASPSRRADMFIDPDNDPRDDGPSIGDERATLLAHLRWHRETLQLKCAGLDAADLARRSVEPSTMSLLGLVRHMAEVERSWFRQRMAEQDAPLHFYSDADPDGAFDGAVPDPAVVAEAWEVWRAEVAFTDSVHSRGARPRRRRQRSLARAVLAARAARAHGGEVRPAQRPRRPPARADRREGGPVAQEPVATSRSWHHQRP